MGREGSLSRDHSEGDGDLSTSAGSMWEGRLDRQLPHEDAWLWLSEMGPISGP